MKLLTFFLLILFITTLHGQKDYRVEKEIVIRPEKAKSGLLRFTVKENNNELYKVDKSIDFDIPHPGVGVFSNGNLAIFSAFEKNVLLYSPTGKELKKINLSEFIAEYEVPLFFYIDGNEAYIVLPEMKQSVNRNIFINSAGKIIKEFDTPFEQINGISYSSSAKLAVTSKISWRGVKPVKEIIFRNLKGEVLNSIEGAFFKGEFTSAGFWAIDKQQYMLINPKVGMIFEERLQAGKIVLDIIDSADEVYIVTSTAPELKQGAFVSDKLEILVYSGEKKSGVAEVNENIAYERMEVTELYPVVIGKSGVRIPIAFLN